MVEGREGLFLFKAAFVSGAVDRCHLITGQHKRPRRTPSTSTRTTRPFSTKIYPPCRHAALSPDLAASRSFLPIVSVLWPRVTPYFALPQAVSRSNFSDLPKDRMRSLTRVDGIHHVESRQRRHEAHRVEVAPQEGTGSPPLRGGGRQRRL